ncbi:MAG: N-acetylmuramoyl-L-alanine amidase [Lachnospiraceae bacterium]|nr:N-acetylmuramoyl-L-alanine amidase [Lachnospiraceae bacterium]MCM1304715.1 N-acetylmuramoyl-L-alanine amidase [Butyrivibrio sp.]MCM1344933.1 N-acetylmuramoyl-L-alanine amidase [Muribaculaceae bacterium]MCM1240781.1 N-acetylmuramoyl-L-alanine amidase [Lachnospiraceae bacterium]MCM1240804.1 N-acetylmuramoyl-L-alanine amidase [Lachnospiraceae bacterium]
METKRIDPGKLNMMITLALWIVFFVVSMAVMLHLSAHKTIVIADMPQDQAGLTAGIAQTDHALELRSTENDGSFVIPLPENVRAEDVIMENRYMERELWVHIRSEDAQFYGENAVSGDTSAILEARYEIQPDGMLLKFAMSSLQEYHSTMNDHALEVAGCKPGDMYPFIVVIDPVGGGREIGLCSYVYREKELALQIAKMIQADCALSDVKLYFTRTEDVEVSAEERTALVRALDADLYIRIGAAEDPTDESIYGIQCWYNEEYFIPGFGNVDLADIVARNVTIASSNRARGLMPAEEDSILKEIGVPAVRLSVGYLSNDKERNLLQQEAYLEKVSEGIINAIEESCQRLEDET